MIEYRVDFDRLEWISPIPGVRQRIYGDGNRRVRLVEYTGEMEPHWCSKGHLGYILEGRFEIEFDGGKEVFEAGDGVFIPDGERHRHRARALSPSVLAIFVEDE